MSTRSGEFAPGTQIRRDQPLAMNRERYALRVGVRGDLADDFYYGLRLETSPNPRSPWNTFGNSTTAPYQGPFSKQELLPLHRPGLFGLPSLFVASTTFRVGRVPQPFYTTPMVWDSDYCPEGLVEKVKFTVGNAELFGHLWP